MQPADPKPTYAQARRALLKAMKPMDELIRVARRDGRERRTLIEMKRTVLHNALRAGQ